MEYATLNSTQVDQKIRHVADNPRHYAQAVRNLSSTERMPWWSIWRHLDKLTGMVSRVDDIFYVWSLGWPIHAIQWLPHNNPQACGYTALAFAAQNMFCQKSVVEFGKWHDFTCALQDQEPGIFSISATPLEHQITIIKFFETGSAKYRVVQSFAGQYSLKNFIETHGNVFNYPNFESFHHNFLSHLENFFFKKESLTHADVVPLTILTVVPLTTLTKLPSEKLLQLPLKERAEVYTWGTATKRKGLPWGTNHYWERVLPHAVSTLLIAALLARIALSMMGIKNPLLRSALSK